MADVPAGAAVGRDLDSEAGFRDDWLSPPSSLAPGVHCVFTTRAGTFSAPPYDGFNLAMHVGDDPASVLANRARLRTALQLDREPAWLEQVHGIEVIDAATVDPLAPPPRADASFTRENGVACVVMTADCLPVVLAASDGSVVGVAHAGWKGLCGGVIEALAAAMEKSGVAMNAWLGPCIGPSAFEVGSEVRDAFLKHDARAVNAFAPTIRADGTPGFLCDLYALARQRLAALGISSVSGGEHCTVAENRRFYSFRSARVTGRCATLVWKTPVP